MCFTYEDIRPSIQLFLISTRLNVRNKVFKEEYGENPQVEKEVYKHLKEQGFEFDISENYGEPLVEGTYKVKHDIYNLEGDIVINIDEEVDFKATTDTILGYDVFKYKDVYLTTEDLYANA